MENIFIIISKFFVSLIWNHLQLNLSALMQKVQTFSTGYRNQAVKALFAILLFILVYLAILTFSIILVGFLFYESFAIVPKSLSRLFINIALFVTAFILLIFIIYFFFRKSSFDRSRMDRNKWKVTTQIIRTNQIHCQSVRSPLSTASIFVYRCRCHGFLRLEF